MGWKRADAIVGGAAAGVWCRGPPSRTSAPCRRPQLSPEEPVWRKEEHVRGGPLACRLRRLLPKRVGQLLGLLPSMLSPNGDLW